MLHWLQQPWPWYVSGPLIGLMVPLLLLLGNKVFGISSSLRHICAACLPAKLPFFNYNWKAEQWNLFFVRGGRLYTPEIGTGILPGITRIFVMELAERQGLQYAEGYYTWDELIEAEEIFLTNSIQELVPVTTLVEPKGMRYSVGDGRIGPITEMLLNSYRSYSDI